MTTPRRSLQKVDNIKAIAPVVGRKFQVNT